MEHQKALDKAKIALMSTPDTAFFTTICFSLVHQWDDTIGTACTNGKYIKYSTKFFMKLDQDERLFLLLHETSHVAFLHVVRRGNRCPRKWNYATDYFINNMWIKRGFKMPEGGLYDPQYDGMSADQIYDLLPDPEEIELPSWEDLIEADEPLTAEAEITDILVRAHIHSKMAGDKPGTIPGEIQIFLDNLLKPKLPWKVILQRHMQALSKNDYSWARPNRRFFPRHYLPSLYSETVEDIVFAIDASGSVSDEEFKQYVSDISGVMKTLRPKKITLITFDVGIRAIDVIYTAEDLMRIKFTGRGGTNVNPVIEWAAQNKPKVMVIFSDGHFKIREPDPKVSLIWTIHNKPTFTAPYGKVINFTL